MFVNKNTDNLHTMPALPNTVFGVRKAARRIERNKEMRYKLNTME
ncbi:hypothetical protein HMPREF1870_02522 [Bacteroidales bacterium KA00344]|nr:hypothetical protein HMPREF1870_02522 [Bacteroidales bacterium KA00344]